jgi:hypothetical protein
VILALFLVMIVAGLAAGYAAGYARAERARDERDRVASALLDKGPIT